MNQKIIRSLAHELRDARIVCPTGTVKAVQSNVITIAGLSHIAKLGDLVHVRMQDMSTLPAEVIRVEDHSISVLPDGTSIGLHLGAFAFLQNPPALFPCDDWLGRVLDPNGASLDGRKLIRGETRQPLFAQPPPPHCRRGFGKRLRTGSHALNTILPLVSGQRIGLFAGSGVGKSSLLGQLAQHIDCDVVVAALIGERGRELRNFTESVLGPEGLKKSVVVAATADRPALERRRCAWTAMSIAEYFRDQGKSVLYLADSVTRFAEANREVASAAGEIPVLRGHPPSSVRMISELCERAGPGIEGAGDITAVFSVLVPGSDMDEPIADILRGVLDGHIVLDREIAERGRYPAINILKSVSRSLPDAASAAENVLISKARSLVSVYEKNEMMVRSGLYTEGADAELDTALRAWSELDAFWGLAGQNSPEDCFDRLRLILRRSGLKV